jgi:hypothetical protein
MLKASEVIEIFLNYDISNVKDQSKYEISELDGITNTSFVVLVDNKKFVLRIPGENPDVINRLSEKYNTKKAEEYGLTLPCLIFDEDTGIKISEFFDIYTYKAADFKNKNMRNSAFNVLNKLHKSDLIFKNNFSPMNVFKEIADISVSIEQEAKEVGIKIVNKLNEIGINNHPCHQDLYSGKFDFDKNLRNEALNEIGIFKEDEIYKFEIFEILSMITWGLWALKRSPKDNDGHRALNKAIKLCNDKKL